MDGKNFDRFAQRFAADSSRRALVKSLAGAALAAGLGTLRPGHADAATCKPTGQICREHANCCSGRCGPKDGSGRRRCTCPPGTTGCNGTCVNPNTAFTSDIANCGACGTKCPRTRCQLAVCQDGVCALAPDPNADGRSCDDGDKCTQTDMCQNGSCTGGNPVVCPPPNVCQNGPGTCNATTGQCTYTNKENNTSCDDGDPCTNGTTCQDGVCTGGTLFPCPPSADPCTLNICVAINGNPVCQNTAIPGCTRP